MRKTEHSRIIKNPHVMQKKALKVKTLTFCNSDILINRPGPLDTYVKYIS